MRFDIIDGSTSEDTFSFMTIGELISLAQEHPEKYFRFFGTSYTVGELHSWRGSYDLPAISYENTELRTGKDIACSLGNELDNMHCGWKGGKYYYCPEDEFYVASRGSSAEYKVVSFTVTGEEVVLNTKTDPY